MKQRAQGLTTTPSTRFLRAIDVLLITVSAPIWLPVLAVCAVIVAVSSPGPVLFRQPRAGRHGHEFTMLKLRSMRAGTNPVLPQDCEITRAGRLLRATSLDELPQLFNVLAGHMSLVGPRPMLVSQASLLDASQRQRHAVRPGLTGLAQVSGRNEISWPRRIELDRQWARSPTVLRYLLILGRTAGLLARGASTDGHARNDPFVSSLTIGDAS